MPPKPILKSVAVEFRPNLKCLNVFLLVNNQKNNIKLKVSRDSVCVTDDGQRRETVPIFGHELLVDSLTSLKVDRASISFRVSIAGGFSSEILPKSSTGGKTSSAAVQHRVKEKTAYAIKCANCKNRLGDSDALFRRVLPLPSENFEPANLFCHAPKDVQQQLSALDPREDDCFTSNSYFHINSKLCRPAKESGTILCDHCYSWLGSRLSEHVCRLWFSTCSFEADGEATQAAPLEDFLATIKLGQEESVSRCCKLVLECRTRDSETNYLLLWILESSLELYISELGGEERLVSGSKVLFKFEPSRSEMVVLWKRDGSINCYEIAKPMLCEGLKYFFRMSKCIPKCYGFSNDFCISYMTA